MEPGTGARSAAGSPKAAGVWGVGGVEGFTTVVTVVEVDSTPSKTVVEVELPADSFPVPEHATPTDITAASVTTERSILGFTTLDLRRAGALPLRARRGP